MPKQLTCEDCGEIDHAWFNGYHIGGRLLEGVMFDVRLGGDKFTATLQSENESYFRDNHISKAKWQKAVVKAVTDDPNEMLECPKCGFCIDVVETRDAP